MRSAAARTWHDISEASRKDPVIIKVKWSDLTGRLPVRNSELGAPDSGQTASTLNPIRKLPVGPQLDHLPGIVHAEQNATLMHVIIEAPATPT